MKLKFDSFDQMQAGYTANVSRGGMFVHVADARPVGSLLRFELDLGVTEAPITGFGEIVWIRLKQRTLQQPPGIGVQFRHLEAESVSHLETALRSALVDLSASEESPESAAGATQRTDRLLRELQEALGRCEDLGPTLERDK